MRFRDKLSFIAFQIILHLLFHNVATYVGGPVGESFAKKVFL